MVKRVINLHDKQISSKGPLSAMLTNGFGSYFAIDETLSYQGWYILDPSSWRMQKIIESITPLNIEAKELDIDFSSIRRKYNDKTQETFFTYQKTLLYSTLGMLKSKVRLTLDHRESYESSRMGRNYTIDVAENYVTIKFSQENEYDSYLVIKGVKDVTLVNSWKEKHYSFDNARGTNPNYWVFDALDFSPSYHVVFAVGKSKDEARTLADISYFHFDDIISNIQTKTISNNFEIPHIQGQLGIAVASSAYSIQSLLQNFSFKHKLAPGVYAGLPWFFQIWSRDELISLGGLIYLARENNDYELFSKIKNILNRNLKSVRADGDIPNRFPKSILGSVDALGWLGKRLKDFLVVLREEKIIYTLFSPEELVGWSNHLKDALESVKKSRMQDGLFVNKSKETWMDTIYNDDGREGKRVEIQALFYALYDCIVFIERLVKSPFLKEMIKEQKQFKQSFRDKFLVSNFSGLLVDGFNNENHVDRTFRPNVFLAAFLAPNLLKDSEWKKVFDSHLEKLFIPWGGLSTVDFGHPLYQPTYTGENNKSYHRGDSWYFVNHLAALALEKLDKKKYEHQIRSIEFATSNDCLSFGFLGHFSEVSSASFQEAQGCFAQSWSAATFLELMLFRYIDND